MDGQEWKKRASGKRPKAFGKRRFTGNRYTRQTEKKDETEPQPSSEAPSSPPERILPARKTKKLRAENAPSTSSAQATVTSETTNEPDLVESAASRKLRRSLDPVVNDSRKDWSGFRVVDSDLVFSAIAEVTVCNLCGTGSISIVEKESVGLYSIFEVHCEKCGVTKEVGSCEKVGKKRQAPEANRRAVYACKSLGLGHKALEEFSALMDFPPAVSSQAFDKAVDAIHEATTSVAHESMKRAAKEEEELTCSQDVTVSGDGSWMKRGFTSLFGVMTLIGLLSGKVLDFVVLSLMCSGCSLYKGPKSGPEFEEWQDEHASKCQKNHEGSSGSMEVSGIFTLFSRSVKERGLRYLKYIGDGDSKTYKAISENKPYDESKVSKLECTAHVKKRMGTRLRKLVDESKGKMIGGKKGLGGAGRLTKKMIDKISDYYGMAVQSNKDVNSMFNAIWAIFHHLSSTDKKPTHHLCPQGLDSWCPYQKAVSAGKVEDYKHSTKNTVPLPVMEACRKVFTDLSAKDLLERCVGGYTQNPNESFNVLIWQTCSKVLMMV